MQQFCYMSWIKWPRHKIVVGPANRQFTQRPWWTIRDQTGMPISKNGVMRMPELFLRILGYQKPSTLIVQTSFRASTLSRFGLFEPCAKKTIFSLNVELRLWTTRWHSKSFKIKYLRLRGSKYCIFHFLGKRRFCIDKIHIVSKNCVKWTRNGEIRRIFL